MAQSRHKLVQRTCPLSGAKQTLLIAVRTSAFLNVEPLSENVRKLLPLRV
jgi:hypothetical protein